MADQSFKLPLPGGKPERMGVWAPATIVAFIALTLVETYYVRLRILDRHRVSAMEIDDADTPGPGTAALQCDRARRGCAAARLGVTS